MDALFLKLLNISITAGWIVIAVVAVRFLLKKAPKWIICLLWALVAIRLVCPFSFESVLSLVPSADTIPDTIISEESFNVDSGFSVIDNNVNSFLDNHYHEGVTVPENTGSKAMTALGTVWLAGMSAMLIYAAASYVNLKKKISAKIQIEKGIFICDEVRSPFILGVIKPQIYLPSNLNDEQKNYVLSHELAHLKRMDNLWMPLGFVILSVYWFNPVMWLAYILLCRDIESACDEKVIKNMNDENRAGYSQALLDCGTDKRSIRVCPVAFGETGVKQRVKSVLNYKKPAFWVIIGAVVISIVVAVCFMTNPLKDKINLLPETEHKGEINTVYTIVAGKSTEPLAPTLALNPQNKTATFSFGVMSSYLAMGEYEKTETSLKFVSKENDCVLFFDKNENGYTFNKEKSEIKSESMLELITDGTKLIPEPIEVNDVANQVILADNNDKDWSGECYTAGTNVLEHQKKGNKEIIYAETMFVSFGFENGYFTDEGAAIVPAVITADVVNGEYSIKYAQDGADYASSIKRMFPKKYQKKVLETSAESKKIMWDQCVSQAELYLSEIGRNEKVKSWSEIEHTMFTDVGVSVDVSNRLQELLKWENYYEYIGYKEVIEDGVRYTYKTSYSDVDDALFFQKIRREDGEYNVVKMVKMNIKTGEITSVVSHPDNQQ